MDWPGRPVCRSEHKKDYLPTYTKPTAGVTLTAARTFFYGIKKESSYPVTSYAYIAAFFLYTVEEGSCCCKLLRSLTAWVTFSIGTFLGTKKESSYPVNSYAYIVAFFLCTAER